MRLFNKHFALILILFIAPAGKHTIAKEQNADSINTKYSIEQCVNEFNFEKSEKTKAGCQYWFSDKNYADGKTLKMSVVKPGLEVHPPKANAVDEFLFVVEGIGEYYLNGKTKKVGPLTSLFYPANAVCGLKNIGKSDLKYLVIRPFGNKK